MKIFLVQALLGIAFSACLSDEELIKSNEGEINFKPDFNSRTVCWGSNAKDLKYYLNLDYDHMAKYGQAVSQADCDDLLRKKLLDARTIANNIFGASKPECSCARATIVDIIYDISPAGDKLETPTLASVELNDLKPMLASNYYFNYAESGYKDFEESAYEWIQSYYWCYNNINRCSNDAEQLKNFKCEDLQEASAKLFIQ